MDEKKQFLEMALSCLRNEKETDPNLKIVNGGKKLPTEDELCSIREGLRSGDVDETILKKFFPTAYEGIVKYGLYRFYFLEHNKSLSHIPAQANSGLPSWCRAYPGKVVEKDGTDFFVEIADGKKIKTGAFRYNDIQVVDESKIETGSYVALHRGKIHMVLNKDEFEKASKFYKEFQKESEI
jgi:hydrogenase maturation factor